MNQPGQVATGIRVHADCDQQITTCSLQLIAWTSCELCQVCVPSRNSGSQSAIGKNPGACSPPKTPMRDGKDGALHLQSCVLVSFAHAHATSNLALTPAQPSHRVKPVARPKPKSEALANGSLLSEPRLARRGARTVAGANPRIPKLKKRGQESRDRDARRLVKE